MRELKGGRGDDKFNRCCNSRLLHFVRGVDWFVLTGSGEGYRESTVDWRGIVASMEKKNGATAVEREL